MILNKLEAWLSLLWKLARKATDLRDTVATASLDTLHMLIKNNGGIFSQDFWRVVIQDVFNFLFDEIQSVYHAKNQSGQANEILLKTFKQAYIKVIDIYKVYSAQLKGVLPEFLQMIVTPIKNPHDVRTLLIFDDDDWLLLFIAVPSKDKR